VLQFLQPVKKNNIEIEAPILQNQLTTIKFNNSEKASEIFRIPSDTIFTETSPVNANTSLGKYVFRKANWQSLNDSLEIFVNEVKAPYMSFKQTKSIINSYNNSNLKLPKETNSQSEIFPNWLSLLLCLLMFIAVWLEAKW
jgi:hypothetical protein